MGYSNDQFYNLPYSESNIRTGVTSGVKTNKKFDYPSNKIRTVSRDTSSGELIFTTRDLKKGYIRNFKNTYQSGALDTSTTPIVRCDFQFNPTSLQQAVAMRTDVLNIFQQDASQITQPLASQTQFGFQLLFDRSYTYNNESDQVVAEADQGSYDLPNIGVLHDIRLLYSIIGQGISEDMINAAVLSARNTAYAEQKAAGSLDVEAGGEATAVTIPIDFDTQASSYFNANLGNSGFLIPLPVRVVFSSLYMVDGYVTSSSIVFSKFSSTYVPLQCMVNLDMQALYIGFAKERTFLTVNLDQATSTVQASIEANKKAVEDASVLKTYLPTLDYQIRASSDTGKYRNRYLAYLIKDVDGEEVIKSRSLSMRILNSSNADPIGPLLTNNPTAISVTMNFIVDFYTCQSDTAKNELIQLLQSGETSPLPQNVTLMSTSSTSHVVTTKEGWDSLKDFGRSYDFAYSPTAGAFAGKEYAESLSGDTEGRYGIALYHAKPEMVVSVGGGAETYTYNFVPVIASGEPKSTLSRQSTQSTLA